MGNLKQRLIKAGRDYNYAEGVKVKATEAVYQDQVVYKNRLPTVLLYSTNHGVLYPAEMDRTRQ